VAVVYDVCIVDDGRTAIDIPPTHIAIAVYVTGKDMSCRGKYPQVDRNAYGDMHTYAGHHRSPAIITIAGAPFYPCGAPLIPWNPSPASIRGIDPSAVMKRCPTPIVVGDPGVAIFGHDPISVGIVWTEARRNVRKPNVTVVWVVLPKAVRG